MFEFTVMGADVAARGLRERKKARTRADIVRAAYNQFRKNGFDKATIDAIAAEAGVARRTYFRYFESKEAVVFHGTQDRLAAFERLLEQADPAATGLDAVRSTCIAMAKTYMERRDELVEIQYLVRSSPELIAYELDLDTGFENAIKKAVAARSRKGPGSDFRSSVLAGALMGVIRATLRAWFDDRGKGDLVRMARRAYDYVEGMR